MIINRGSNGMIVQSHLNRTIAKRLEDRRSNTLNEEEQSEK